MGKRYTEEERTQALKLVNRRFIRGCAGIQVADSLDQIKVMSADNGLVIVLHPNPFRGGALLQLF